MSYAFNLLAFNEQSGVRIFPPVDAPQKELPEDWEAFLTWYKKERGVDACPLYEIINAESPLLLIVNHEDDAIVCYRLSAERLRMIITGSKYSEMIDPLTGALRKEHTVELIGKALDDYIDLTTPFCLMFIDLDHFKKINDTYGHVVGDHVLNAAASKIRKMLRDEDILIRYGGEEFIAIIRKAPLPVALKVAERIRSNVASIPIETDEYNISVTVSIGITTPERSDSALSLIERSDNALYKAKTNGRNRIEYL